MFAVKGIRVRTRMNTEIILDVGCFEASQKH